MSISPSPYPTFYSPHLKAWQQPKESVQDLNANRHEFIRRQEALVHKNWMYFLSINVPLTAMITAFSYTLSRRYNQETQAVQTFSELCQLRKNMMQQLDNVSQPGFVQSQLGTHWGYMQLRQLKMKVTSGAEPSELRQSLKLLGPEMHQNGPMKRLLADTEQYIQTYDRLIANPSHTRTLAKIPVFARLLQMRVTQVEHLVKSNPKEFLKRLFQLSLADLERFGPQFFTKISMDLAKASQRRSLLMTGIVGIGLLGSFWEILHAENRNLRTL